MNVMRPSASTLYPSRPVKALVRTLLRRRVAVNLLLSSGLVAGALSAHATPWHLGSVSSANAAPAAINTYGLSPGPHPVVVAVIDSGVIAEHPSLAGRLLPGYDMQSAPANLRGARSDNYAPDPLGTKCPQRAATGSYRTHGTEVASIIAGTGDNDVLGVNPKAKIVPIRVMGACGMSRRDLVESIRWAAGLQVDGVPDNPNPARVINLSLTGGNTTCSPVMQTLINQITAQGVFVVAAAGNSFHKPLMEPANCLGVISVGAVDAENRIEIYSALDPRTSVYAPGGGKQLESREPWAVNKLRVATYDLDFFGRERANALDRGVGTSYAAPVVSGFIALWLSHQPQIKPTDIFNELPKFLREVVPIEKCADCKPRGLAANVGMTKP